jgi:hypothetical protein
MPDAAPAAAPAAASAPQVAAPPASPAAPSATVDKPVAAETPSSPPAAAPDALERRAEAIAKVKRAEAKLQARKDELDKRDLSSSEKFKKAEAYDRFDELRRKDPLAYLEAVGLKVGDISKLYLEKQTGAGKTPQQIAEEVYDRRMAADEQRRAAEQQKAAEEAKAKNLESAYAGAKKQLEGMIAANPDKYDLSSKIGQGAVDMAFDIVLKFHQKNNQLLEFDKALDAVELKLLTAASTSGKVSANLAKLKLEADEAAKKLAEAEKQSGIKAAPKVDSRVREETAEVQSPKPKPFRRLMPKDQRKIADELVLSRIAAKDS